MSCKRAGSIALWIVAASPRLLACPVCFGAADGPLLTAARTGVLVMAAITCATLAVLAAFFMRVAAHARAAERERLGDGNGHRKAAGAL